MLFEIRVRIRVLPEAKEHVPEAIINIKEFIIAFFRKFEIDLDKSMIFVTINIENDEKKKLWPPKQLS